MMLYACAHYIIIIPINDVRRVLYNYMYVQSKTRVMCVIKYII
jgi:hypothetical protein